MSDTSEDELDENFRENERIFSELEENFGELDDEIVPELEAVHDSTYYTKGSGSYVHWTKALFSLFWRNRNQKSKKDDHSLL